MADKLQLDVHDLAVSPPKKAKDYLSAYKGWVYSAISLISDVGSTVPINLYRRQRTDQGNYEIVQIHNHESLSLLHYANDYQSEYQIRRILHTYKLLLGEAYLYLNRSNGQIDDIIPLRPDWVEVKPDGRGGIAYYIFRTGGGKSESVKLNPENVLPFKDFDPLNPYRGYGKVRPGAVDIDIDDYSDQWNRNYFWNSAIPSLILSTDKNLKKEEKQRFVSKWQQSYGGINNSNKIAFFSGGKLNTDVLGVNMQEMDFESSKERLMEKILSNFHLSKSTLGITNNVNLSNAEVQEQQLYKLAVKPELISYVEFLNEYYLPLFNLEEDHFYNFEDISSDDMDRKLNKLETASRQNWMTVNEIRAELNLDPVTGGDYIYKPLNMAPVGGNKPLEDVPQGIAPNGQETPTGLGTGPDDDEEGKGLGGWIKSVVGKNNVVDNRAGYIKMRPIKSNETKFNFGAPVPPLNYKRVRRERLKGEAVSAMKNLMIQLMENDKVGKKKAKGEIDYKYNIGTVYTEKQKDLLWDNFLVRSEQYQKRIREIVRELAIRQETVVLNKLKKLQKLRSPSQIFFELKDENYKFTRKLRPYLADIIKEQGNIQLDRVRLLTKGYENLIEKQPDDFDMTVDVIVDYLDGMEGDYINDINKVTLDKIDKVTSEGIKDGLTIPEISARLSEIFVGLRTYRADGIARTRSMQVMSLADYSAYKQSGVVVEQSWLSARDGRVRETHREADGQVIELNEKFVVGGSSLRMPRDPSGPAEEILQCRCTTLPITINMKEQINKITTKNMDLLAEKLAEVLEKKMSDKRRKQLEEKRKVVDKIKDTVKKEMVKETGKILKETDKVKKEMKKELQEKKREVREEIGQERIENEAIAKSEQEELKEREQELIDKLEEKRKKIDQLDEDSERIVRKNIKEIESTGNAKKEEIIEEHENLKSRLQAGYNRLTDKFKELRGKVTDEKERLKKVELRGDIKNIEEEYEEKSAFIERSKDRAKEILDIARRSAKREKDEVLEDVKYVKGELESKLEEQKQKEKDEISEVYKRYKDTVNMSASELRAWSETECSRLASVDRTPIKRNLRLLSKKKSEWTKKDVKSANRTISFINRMKGNESGEDVEDSNGNSCGSKRDISLKNWAYDPGK